MKTDHAAACRFFTAEDACRIALAAYYAATSEIEPPPGEPWMIEGTPYAGAGDFADAFMDEVRDRIAALAMAASVPRSGCRSDPLWWPNPDENLSELTDFRRSFLRRIVKHLPPGDNPGNNRFVRGGV